MRSRSRRTLIWAAGGIIGLAALGAAVLTGSKPEYRHPHPRPGVTSAAVLPDFMLALTGFTQAKPAYAIARSIPAVLDGLHCYCNCSMTMGHRSLLACFEDQHGAGCEICQLQAETAAEGSARGQSLQDIRAAIDAAYGGGG